VATDTRILVADSQSVVMLPMAEFWALLVLGST
jgi:hypothetical protein